MRVEEEGFSESFQQTKSAALVSLLVLVVVVVIVLVLVVVLLVLVLEGS